MDLWAGGPPPASAAYTTITTWHNKGEGVVHRGDTYHWTKDRQFEPFLDLPRRRGARFEVAVDTDVDTSRRLGEMGWSQSSAADASTDVARYRAYITRSRAEFTVARDQYVRPWTGWFSDRSACYLAAGRPVVTQETGFSRVLPTGDGIFPFRTMDDVLAAIDAIETDYLHHCRAAQAIAAEHFSAESVLASLMERARL